MERRSSAIDDLLLAPLSPLGLISPFAPPLLAPPAYNWNSHGMLCPLSAVGRGEAGDLREGESYDWFFGYSRMAVYLNLHVGGARAGRVLVLGCGNSEVSPKMWEDGWT